MSILHTLVGSAVSGIVSRVVYTAIDNISMEKENKYKNIWWFILIGIIILVVSVVILCLKNEQNGILHEKKKESFEPYGGYTVP